MSTIKSQLAAMLLAGSMLAEPVTDKRIQKVAHKIPLSKQQKINRNRTKSQKKARRIERLHRKS